MTRTFSAVLAGLLAIVVVAPVAAAAPTAASQPDGRIRLQKITYELFSGETYARPWIGDNRYNTTAYRQAAREKWCCETPGWQRWVFGVSIQNDGTSSDRFRVQATTIAPEGWTVKYLHKRRNITAAVVDGTFTTPLLAPGAEYTIKAIVRLDGGDYENLRTLISLTSVADPGKSDAVKIVMKHVVCTC